MRKQSKLPPLEKRKSIKDNRKLLTTHNIKAHKRKDFGRLNRDGSCDKKLAQLLLWYTPWELEKRIRELDKESTIELYRISRYGRRK